MTEAPRRRPGRPPVAQDDPSVPLTVSVPSKQLAAYKADAQQHHLTIQNWIRRVLRDATQARRGVTR
jgi:predicted DNA binding CopG/RHH family protein